METELLVTQAGKTMALSHIIIFAYTHTPELLYLYGRRVAIHDFIKLSLISDYEVPEQ